MGKHNSQRKSRHKMWNELKKHIKAVIRYEEENVLLDYAVDKDWDGKRRYVYGYSKNSLRAEAFKEVLSHMSEIDGGENKTLTDMRVIQDDLDELGRELCQKA